MRKFALLLVITALIVWVMWVRRVIRARALQWIAARLPAGTQNPRRKAISWVVIASLAAALLLGANIAALAFTSWRWVGIPLALVLISTYVPVISLGQKSNWKRLQKMRRSFAERLVEVGAGTQAAKEVGRVAEQVAPAGVIVFIAALSTAILPLVAVN